MATSPARVWAEMNVLDRVLVAFYPKSKVISHFDEEKKIASLTVEENHNDTLYRKFADVSLLADRMRWHVEMLSRGFTLTKKTAYPSR